MAGKLSKHFYEVVETVEKRMLVSKNIGVWKTIKNKNGFIHILTDEPRYLTILKSTEGILVFCIELKKGDFYEIAGSGKRKTYKKDITFRIGI